MENLIQGTSTKLKEWLALFQRQRQVRYGVLVVYLLVFSTEGRDLIKY